MKEVIAAFVGRYGWPVQATGRPLCIGHRGACAHANENTLAGFEVAARLGADMWELDARLSCDGVVVVCHDAGVTRADGSRIVLAEHTGEAITRVKLARGGAVPTLQQVIELSIAAGRGLYVEVKERAAVRPVVQLLSSSAVPFAAVGSFDHDTVRDLVAARRGSARFPVSVLVRVGDDPFRAAAETGAEVVHLCWEHAASEPDRLLTPGLLARAAKQGLPLVIWHEERRAVLDRLMGLPALGICTDKPEMMNRYAPDAAYPIEVVCHRGMNVIAPENTLHAARLCFEQGFQVVELDVRRSSDGGCVVIHDATLDRTTDGTGPVAGLTMAELVRHSAGIRFDPFFREERLVPLSAFLQAAGAEGQLYIEIKDAEPDAVLREVERFGMLSRVFFWSADASRLGALRRMSGGVRLMAEHGGLGCVGEAIEALRPAVIQFDAERDDLAGIDACRGAGVKSMVKYFGADRTVFERIIRLRPNMINLDRPDLFLRAYAMVVGSVNGASGSRHSA